MEDRFARKMDDGRKDGGGRWSEAGEIEGKKIRR
jgi:hypothetical protein